MPADLPDAPAAPRPRQPRWLLVTMIVMSIGYVGIFVFSLMMAITSPMMFDSGETSRAWAAVIGALIFPFFVIGNVALAWCGYGFRRRTLIPVGFTLPFLYMVVFWMYFA